MRCVIYFFAWARILLALPCVFCNGNVFQTFQANDNNSATVSATNTPTESNESSLNDSSVNGNVQQSIKSETNGKKKRKREKKPSETETNHENGDKDKKSKKRKKDRKKEKLTEDEFNERDDACNEEAEENETEKQSNGIYPL